MGWIKSFFTSSIGRKIIMSLTGLFLTLFLVVHLVGNIQLLFNDGGEAFNVYAHFMGHNPLIQTISIGNFAFIVLHFVMATALTLKNRKSRNVRYEASNKSGSWASRNMYIFGAVILVFIIIHLSNFWFVSKFGSVCESDVAALSMECQNEYQRLGGKDLLNSTTLNDCKTAFSALQTKYGNDGNQFSICKIDYGDGPIKDLYSVVQQKFSNPLYAIFYIACMVFIAFHLWHGFQSAFQTIGASHQKYTPIIRSAGYLLSVLLSLGFAIIPLLIFIKSLS